VDSWRENFRIARIPRRYNRLEEVQHNVKKASLSKIIVVVRKLDMASVVSPPF